MSNRIISFSSGKSLLYRSHFPPPRPARQPPLRIWKSYVRIYPVFLRLVCLLAFPMFSEGYIVRGSTGTGPPSWRPSAWCMNPASTQRGWSFDPGQRAQFCYYSYLGLRGRIYRQTRQIAHSFLHTYWTVPARLLVLQWYRRSIGSPTSWCSL